MVAFCKYLATLYGLLNKKQVKVLDFPLLLDVLDDVETYMWEDTPLPPPHF